MCLVVRDNVRTVRMLGLLGILTSTMAVLSDLASSYSNNPSGMDTAISLDIESVAGLLTTKPHWQLVIGHYLAIFTIPFAGIFVVTHTYFGLKPVSDILAGAYWFVGIGAYAIGTAYHGTYGFIAEAIQRDEGILLSDMADYFEPLGLALTGIVLVWAIYWLLLILSGRSKYPRWMSLISPASVIALSTLLTTLLPSTSYGIRSFITVTGLNLPVLIWTITSSIILWN